MFGSFFKKVKQDLPEKPSRDPVCGMQARGDVTHIYNGTTYAFCSEHCKEQFEKNPEAYVVK